MPFGLCFLDLTEQRRAWRGDRDLAFASSLETIGGGLDDPFLLWRQYFVDMDDTVPKKVSPASLLVPLV
ncbi:hypothetical protein P3S67_014895 [Capsicum chacoense]